MKKNNDYLNDYKKKVIKLFLIFSFSIIYFISSLFFIYLFFQEKEKSKEELLKIKSHIENIVEKSWWVVWLMWFIEKDNIDNTVDALLELWNKEKSKQKKDILLKKIKIFILDKTNKNILYENFNRNLCWKKYNCLTIDKNWYVIYFWKSKKEDFSLAEMLFLYFIISLLITWVLYIPFNFLINKITKPVEENLEFMKNFVNNAWHELKTPLTEINLEAQVMKLKKLFDENRINNIIKKSKDLWDMLDNLLNLSTISEKEKLNIENINIIELINEIINENWYSKKIKIIKKFKNNEISIKWDKWLLKILIRNLLSNAYKYNSNEEDKKYIKIIVNNNKLEFINPWKNIPQNEIYKIFDIFHRVKDKWWNKWFWLWLALVKKICNILWYKIEVISKDWINKFNIIF